MLERDGSQTDAVLVSLDLSKNIFPQGFGPTKPLRGTFAKRLRGSKIRNFLAEN